MSENQKVRGETIN